MMISQRHKITIFLTHKCVFNYRSPKERELILKKPFCRTNSTMTFFWPQVYGRNSAQAENQEIIKFYHISSSSSPQQIKDELSEVVQEMESHENEIKHPSKEKQMSIGRKKFNMDPKKGNCIEKNPFML